MNNYLTVSALNRYIKGLIDHDLKLQQVYLKAEISNFKAHSSGHLYFSLKDENSRINAVMFASYAKALKIKVEDGMKVIVEASVSVYEVGGNYQLYVKRMQLDGIGDLHIRYEQLKKQLQERGLFDVSHKKTFPKYPRRIGIITARTGAAIHDIITTLNRRYPVAKIYIFPSLVQGEAAKEDIVKQIKIANQYPLDAIILGRGGGSIEDLWAFNEEIVANAIYESETPIVSGVGHDVDVTIADYVADLRAATPTAAAELITPSIDDMMIYLDQLHTRLNQLLTQSLSSYQHHLDQLKNHYLFKYPMRLFEPKQQQLNVLKNRLNYLTSQFVHQQMQQLSKLDSQLQVEFNRYIEKNKDCLKQCIRDLQVLSPLTTLARGYGIIYQDQQIISSVDEVNMDETLVLQLQDGHVYTKPIEKEHQDGK